MSLFERSGLAGCVKASVDCEEKASLPEIRMVAEGKIVVDADKSDDLHVEAADVPLFSRSLQCSQTRKDSKACPSSGTMAQQRKTCLSW